MAVVSIGPSAQRDDERSGRIPQQGRTHQAGLYAGNVTGAIILNTAMARVQIKRVLLVGTTLQGTGLIAAGAISRNLWCLIAAYLVVGFSGALMNTSCWMWVSAHVKKNTAAAALQMILFFAFAI